jgi:hypothetical protein
MVYRIEILRTKNYFHEPLDLIKKLEKKLFPRLSTEKHWLMY